MFDKAIEMHQIRGMRKSKNTIGNFLNEKIFFLNVSCFDNNSSFFPFIDFKDFKWKLWKR